MPVRPRTATVLSLTGVLLAGAAATAINAGVLRGPTPAALAEPITSVPAGGTPSVPAADPAAPLAVYTIGDAGSVSVRTMNGGIEVAAVSPSPGWSSGAVSRTTAQSLSVDLLSAAQGVRFSARLVGGIVTTSVESVPGTGSAAATPPDSSATPVSAPSAQPTSPSSLPDDDDHRGSGPRPDDHGGHHEYEDGDD